MAEILDEPVAAVHEQRAGDGVAAHVTVGLLRPVADVDVHVDPELGVLEPLLHPRLVGAQLGDALADPDHEDDATGRRALTGRVVEPA